MDKLPEFIANHPVLSLLFFGLVVALFYTEIGRRMSGFKRIAPALATQLINREDAVVLDVSSASDYQKGHIVGARNVPLSQVDPGHKAIAKAKSKPLIVYCRTGQQSPQACSKLVKAGFERVFLLTGGAAAWKAENLPLVAGKK